MKRTTDSGIRWQAIGIVQTTRRSFPRFLAGSDRLKWRRVPTQLQDGVITRWGWDTKWAPRRRHHCLS